MVEVGSSAVSERHFNACLTRVSNRGVPPAAFLNELVDWAKSASEIIFAVNDKIDVYSSVRAELGPWTGVKHRKAVMLEVLRVLAGFESSWKWNEGRDLAAHNMSPETEETGAWQVSCNATAFDPSLKAYVVSIIGARDCRKFIMLMKANHRFAIEFAARLLRFTVNHNGPVKRREVNPFLSRASVAEFQSFLS